MKIDRFIYLLAATSMAATHTDGPELKAVQHPMTELHAVAKFSIPGFPDWVAIADSVWISNKPENNISRLDPKTNRVGSVIPVAKNPCSGLVIAFQRWIGPARRPQIAEGRRDDSFRCREHGRWYYGGRGQRLDAVRRSRNARADRSGD